MNTRKSSDRRVIRRCGNCDKAIAIKANFQGVPVPSILNTCLRISSEIMAILFSDHRLSILPLDKAYLAIND